MQNRCRTSNLITQSRPRACGEPGERRAWRDRVGKGLGDENNPSTRELIPLPYSFNVGKRDWFGVDAKPTARSQRPHLWESLENGPVRNAATAAPVHLNG